MQLERWLFHLLGRQPAWGNVVRWFVNLEIAREPSQSTAKLATPPPPHHHLIIRQGQISNSKPGSI